MDVQGICRELLNQVEGGLGCIVIDMQTGLTVAAESRPGTVLDGEGINLVSVVATNMFSGRLIRQFEDTLARGAETRFVREAHMTTDNLNHFMAVIPGWDDGLLVLVTDSAVSLGLGWMAIHRFVGRFAEAPRPTEAVVPKQSYDWDHQLEAATAASSEMPELAAAAPEPAAVPEPEPVPVPAPAPLDRPDALASVPAAAPTTASPAPVVAAPVAPAMPSVAPPPLPEPAPANVAPIALAKAAADAADAGPPTPAKPEEPKRPALGPRMNLFASRRNKERK